MNIRQLLFILPILAYCAFGSCQTKTDPNAEIVKKVTHLKEFTRSEKRIDSIAAKKGMPFKIGLSIIDQNKDNHPADTSAAFISFNRPFDHITLYVVKFSKKNQKIISIEKQHLGSSLAEYGWTDNTQ